VIEDEPLRSMLTDNPSSTAIVTAVASGEGAFADSVLTVAARHHAARHQRFDVCRCRGVARAC
jgi:hypothetical protein